jgi:hypothetical protein
MVCVVFVFCELCKGISQERFEQKCLLKTNVENVFTITTYVWPKIQDYPFAYKRVLQAPKIEHDTTYHFCDIPRLRLQLTRAGTTTSSTAPILRCNCNRSLPPLFDGTRYRWASYFSKRQGRHQPYEPCPVHYDQLLMMTVHYMHGHHCFLLTPQRSKKLWLSQHVVSLGISKLKVSKSKTRPSGKLTKPYFELEWIHSAR